METNSQQFISDRLKILPKELVSYITSEALTRKTVLVGKKYRLDEEQVRVLQNEIALVLMVLDSVDSLHLNVEEGLGLPADLAEALSLDVIGYIFKNVDQYLAHTQEELLKSDPKDASATYAAESFPETTIRVPETQAQPSAPQSIEIPESGNNGLLRQSPNIVVPQKYQDSLIKADILSEIENPPRTVIKRYVLEHEPITDPDHLIDNRIDNTIKLEDHYND